MERTNLWSLTIYEYLCRKSYWFVYHPPAPPKNPPPDKMANGGKLESLEVKRNSASWECHSTLQHPLRFFWTCADSLPDLRFEAAARKKLTSAYFQRGAIKRTPPSCVNMSSCQKTWRCLDRTRDAKEGASPATPCLLISFLSLSASSPRWKASTARRADAPSHGPPL